MSVPPVTKPCTICSGKGVVPHVRRHLDGKPDPWDQQQEEICATCGGGGTIVVKPADYPKSK